MKYQVSSVCAMVVFSCLPAFGSLILTPTGTYDIRISLSDGSGTEFWSRELLNCGTNLTQAYNYYTEGSNQITLRMNYPGGGGSDTIAPFDWFIDANDIMVPEDILGNNRGKLKITVSNLKFQESTSIMMQPAVTHLYYVGNDNGWMVARSIPGDVHIVSPASASWILERTGVRPLSPGDLGYDVFGPSYGTPTWSNSPVNGMTFEFPDLYVTPSQISQIAFGAGFSVVPEPACLAFLALGAIGIIRRR